MSQQPTPNNPQQPKKPTAPTGKNYTNGLVGLLSGLVLATLIIIAVLLMINSNSKKDFKPEPVLNNNIPKTTETLTPDNSSNVPATVNDAPKTAVITGSDIVAPNMPNSASSNVAANQTAQNNVNVANNAAASQETAAPVSGSNQPTVLPANKLPQANANTRFNQPNQQDDLTMGDGDVIGEPTFAPPVKKTKPQQSAPKTNTSTTNKNNIANNDKPTPQEILDYGSVENARAAKKQQNAVKSTGKGNVILQAGSFNTRDYAETQRAKLALMGVQTHISEAVVNGKKVYRVQTSKLSGERANQAKSVLNSNGVSVYQRSAN